MKNDLELVSSRIFVLFVNFLLCVGDEGRVCVRMLSKFLLRTEKLPSFSCGGYITRVLSGAVVEKRRRFEAGSRWWMYFCRI